MDPRASDLVEKRTLITTPKNFGAQVLLEFWRTRIADDGFVVGRDIPSRPLGNILRNLAVFEPVDEGRDFRVRIAGTALFRRFGRDVTGQKFSELFTPHLCERRSAMVMSAISSSRPVMGDIEMTQGDRKPLCFEMIVLPVLAPDRSTPWALGGMFYHDWVS